MRIALLGLALLTAIGGLGWAILQQDDRPELPESGGTDGSSAADRTHPQGDVFRMCVPPPNTLNPFVVRHPVTTRYVLPWTHDALIDRDPETGVRRAALATKWSVSEDGRRVEFVLRPDVRFADGSPVTADDWRFTIETARDARVQPYSEMSERLRLARAFRVGEGRLEFEFEAPRPDVAIALGEALRVCSRAWWHNTVAQRAPGATPGSNAFFDALCAVDDGGLGTGPMTIARDDAGAPVFQDEFLDLARNPESWRRTAFPDRWNLDAVRLWFSVDEAANLARAKGDESDLFFSLVGADLAQLCADDREIDRRFEPYTYDAPHLAQWFITWNCSRPQLGDSRVRCALGMLFDRERIIREVVNGQGRPAKGWFKMGTPEYPDELPDPTQDIAGARSLLAEAGYGPDRPLRLSLLTSTRPTTRRIANLAKAWFTEAGVELTLDIVERNEVFRREDAGEFDAALTLWQHGTVIDPYDFFVQANRMHHDDATIRDLLVRARSTVDGGERASLYRQFQARLAEEQPITLLYHPLSQCLIHRRYRDRTPGPLGFSIERWWVPEGEQLVGRDG